VYPDGRSILSFIRSPTDHRAQPCCFWSIVKGNDTAEIQPEALTKTA